MAKNLDFAFQLFKRGAILLIPRVTFSNGVTKAKYVVLLEDANMIWKRGRILGCLTTSRKFDKMQSWFSVQPASILGLKEGLTTIDTVNRISLTEDQIKQCKYIGSLNDEQLADVMEAKTYGDMWLQMLYKNGRKDP